MVEIKAKTHLIVIDIHNEYYIQWNGKIANTKPKFKDNKPIFIIVGGNGRTEVATVDMKYIKKCAKLMSKPRDVELYLLIPYGFLSKKKTMKKLSLDD